MPKWLLSLIGFALCIEPCVAVPAAAAATIDLSKGIDASGFMDANGVPAWVTIRGRDRANPAILIIQSNSGAAANLFAREVYANAGWEKDFTLVYWDRPGAENTVAYVGNGLDPGLTLAHTVNEGLAVAEQVALRLGKRKLLLLGNSWGAIIAVMMAHQRPQLFHACIAAAPVFKLPAATTGALETGPLLRLPVFFIHGRDDNVAPLGDVLAFLSWVRAPRKELLMVDGTGRGAITSKPEALLAVLNQQARTLPQD